MNYITTYTDGAQDNIGTLPIDGLGITGNSVNVSGISDDSYHTHVTDSAEGYKADVKGILSDKPKIDEPNMPDLLAFAYLLSEGDGTIVTDGTEKTDEVGVYVRAISGTKATDILVLNPDGTHSSILNSFELVEVDKDGNILLKYKDGVDFDKFPKGTTIDIYIKRQVINENGEISEIASRKELKIEQSRDLLVPSSHIFTPDSDETTLDTVSFEIKFPVQTDLRNLVINYKDSDGSLKDFTSMFHITRDLDGGIVATLKDYDLTKTIGQSYTFVVGNGVFEQVVELNSSNETSLITQKIVSTLLEKGYSTSEIVQTIIARGMNPEAIDHIFSLPVGFVRGLVDVEMNNGSSHIDYYSEYLNSLIVNGTLPEIKIGKITPDSFTLNLGKHKGIENLQIKVYSSADLSKDSLVATLDNPNDVVEIDGLDQNKPYYIVVSGTDLNEATGEDEYVESGITTIVTNEYEVPPFIKEIGDQKVDFGKSFYMDFKNYIRQTNGDEIKSYILDGDLPPGLYFDSKNGVLIGEANQIGDYKVSLTVTDNDGTSNKVDFILSVNFPQIPPSMNQIGTISATQGSVLNLNLSNYVSKTNGDEIEGFILDGDLPSWLNFDEITGKITGTASEIGTFDLKVTAVDDDGESNQVEFSIKILPVDNGGSVPPEVVQPPSAPTGTINGGNYYIGSAGVNNVSFNIGLIKGAELFINGVATGMIGSDGNLTYSDGVNFATGVGGGIDLTSFITLGDGEKVFNFTNVKDGKTSSALTLKVFVETAAPTLTDPTDGWPTGNKTGVVVNIGSASGVDFSKLQITSQYGGTVSDIVDLGNGNIQFNYALGAQAGDELVFTGKTKAGNDINLSSGIFYY